MAAAAAGGWEGGTKAWGKTEMGSLERAKVAGEVLMEGCKNHMTRCTPG